MIEGRKYKLSVPVLCLCLCLFLSGTAFTGCGSTDSSETAEEKASEEANAENGIITLELSSDIDEIYTADYQDGADSELTSLKEQDSYSLESPLIVANPYGTNTTGLYLYFTTETPAELSYTISAEGYDDFAETLYGGYTTEHEYLLTGIVPDTVNTITLTATDQDGNIIGTKEFEYDAPSLLGSEDNIRLEITAGDSDAELSDGLYTMLGNRSTEENEQVDFILLYDNSGTIRSEIPVKSYRACNILFGEDEIYYSTSADEIAVMNRLGKITEIYSMEEYQLHHDYIFGSDNDLLVLASEEEAETEEDLILRVDLSDGTITELIDLADLFGSYLDSLPSDSSDEDEALDWMHINSIRMFDEDSIIISSRETSTIIKIDDIYGDPTVDYMIGSEQFWTESGYDSLLLSQVGEFSLQAGQHCVEYEFSDDLDDGQYYLYFYNNNNTVCSTRGYDYSSDSSYYGTYSGTEGEESMYYRYLVDENERTFELVDEISVTYSGYVSSVQHLGENILVDSGSAFTAVEFDEDHTPIQTLVGTGDTWWYRVFKYDYSGFWFS